MAFRQAQGITQAAAQAKIQSGIVAGQKFRSAVGKGFGKHKVLYSVGGLMAAGGLAAGRRGRGTDRTSGRPTGIYGY